MPTILTKRSNTPGAIPATANLTNAAGGAELAVNTADKRIFTINSSSAVVELGTNPASLTCADVSATVLRAGSATITNLIATTATVSDLSATVARISSLTISSLSLSNATFGSATITNLTSTSATITNLLATSLTVSSGSTLNGGVVINEPGADVDFRVEGDTDANLLFVDASTDRVGVGTSTPGDKLEVKFGTNGYILANNSTDTNTGIKFANTGRTYGIFTDGGSGASNSLRFYDFTAAAERLRLDSSGNLGLGVTPSAWQTDVKAIQIGDAGSNICANNSAYSGGNNVWINSNSFQNSSIQDVYIRTATAGQYHIQGNTHVWKTAPSGTAGNTITFTQAMTLDASGNLGVGTTSPASILDVQSASAIAKLTSTTGTNGVTYRTVNTGGTSYFGRDSSSAGFGSAYATIVWGTGAYPMLFGTNDTERARITSGGILGVGVTAPTGALSDAAGAQLGPTGWIIANRAANPALFVNRKTDDGDLVQFYQADTQEGSISVSGNTVSYNAFAGSHWSQLQDGSKPDILRGTVMESINELCVWPGEQNERLPKSKISDTAGSKKVYGVFMAWDNDWTETNDMYITAVGAFICRVNGSVTVQEGDLLESNGDGTARVQADDIIRSSTIGKVTSTVKTHQYDDGSYCVPTVLYCG